MKSTGKNRMTKLLDGKEKKENRLSYIKTVETRNKKTNKVVRGAEQVYNILAKHWDMTLYEGEIVKTFKGQVAHDIVYDDRKTIVSFYTEFPDKDNAINKYQLISRADPRIRTCKVKRIVHEK